MVESGHLAATVLADVVVVADADSDEPAAVVSGAVPAVAASAVDAVGVV